MIPPVGIAQPRPPPINQTPREAYTTCPRCAGQTYKTARDTTYTQAELNKRAGPVFLGCFGLILFAPLLLISIPMQLIRQFSPWGDHRSQAQLERDSIRYTCLMCGQEWFASKWTEIHAANFRPDMI